MKKYFILFIVVFIQYVNADFTSLDRFNKKINQRQKINTDKNINWISIGELEKKLPKDPINVGFDVHDTIMSCAAPMRKKINESIKKPFSCFDEIDFFKMDIEEDRMLKLWYDINTSISSDPVKYCTEKISGMALIELHIKRDDHIFFITASDEPILTSNEAYNLFHYIRNRFHITTEFTIIYAGETSAEISDIKVKPIRENQITWFYGDSDHDIEDAKKAGAQAVRVLRANDSFRSGGYSVGQFSEFVLRNSDL